MNEESLSVAELVRRLRHGGRRMPFEIGAFIALEACSQIVDAPALLTPADVFVESDGTIRVAPGAACADPAAASAIVQLLAHNLVAAGTGVPPALMDLVEGRSSALDELDALRDELEASLVPLNRGASRRVLARLLRDAPRAVASAGPADGANLSVDDALDTLLAEPTATGALGLAGTVPAPSAAAPEIEGRASALPTVAQPAVPKPSSPSERSDDASSAKTRAHAAVRRPATDAGLADLLADVRADILSSHPGSLVLPDGPAPSSPSATLPADADRTAPLGGANDDATETATALEPVERVGSTEVELGVVDPRDTSPSGIVDAAGDDAGDASTHDTSPQTAPMDAVHDAGERREAGPVERRPVPRRFNQTLPLGAPVPIASVRQKGELPPLADEEPPPPEPADSALATVVHDGPPISTADDEAPPASFESKPSRRRGGRIPDVNQLDDDRPRPVGGTNPVLVASLVVGLLGAAAVVFFLLRGHEEEPVTTEASPPSTAPSRAHGTLEIRTGAPDGEVFLFVGRSPASAEGLPLGVAHELLAVADGKSPARAVVPAEAEYRANEPRPIYELAMPIGEEEMDFEALTLPPSRLEAGAMGSPSGGLGDVRVVTAPPGARVFLLVGIGDRVVVDGLPIDEARELLIWRPTERQSVRRFVGPSDWREEAGEHVATLE